MFNASIFQNRKVKRGRGDLRHQWQIARFKIFSKWEDIPMKKYKLMKRFISTASVFFDCQNNCLNFWIFVSQKKKKNVGQGNRFWRNEIIKRYKKLTKIDPRICGDGLLCQAQAFCWTWLCQDIWKSWGNQNIEMPLWLSNFFVLDLFSLLIVS